jgi:hypothetical protein
MFTLTKSNIDALDLQDLFRVRDALTLLSNYGIDNDRQQTLDYVNKLIKHIEERNIVNEK